MQTSTAVLTDAGLVPERVAALEDRARREIDEGLLPSCQLAPAAVTMPAAPPQPSMPDPCAGVPANPWC
jgi:hypothetical protein